MLQKSMLLSSYYSRLFCFFRVYFCFLSCSHCTSNRMLNRFLNCMLLNSNRSSHRKLNFKRRFSHYYISVVAAFKSFFLTINFIFIFATLITHSIVAIVRFQIFEKILLKAWKLYCHESMIFFCFLWTLLWISLYIVIVCCEEHARLSLASILNFMLDHLWIYIAHKHLLHSIIINNIVFYHYIIIIS